LAEFEDEETRSLSGATVASGPRIVVVWDGGTITRPLVVGKSLVLGRGKECDLPVLDVTVSRRHARIDAPPARGLPMRIEDLGSAHGVRVDGEVIRGPREVRPGQSIEVGSAIVIFQDPSSKAVTPAVGVDRDRFVMLIAKSHLPVLILGETGAGKEVMAARIHRESSRSEGPFVCLSCAALAPTLLESELFGHEKGAFTGANATKPGLIETASGGTLFLDEIGELPLDAQATLLRVLETREVRRIGSVKSFSVNVRILAATNRDLDASVREGKFRQDLLYRLNGATVRVPPLRERKGEIIRIAEDLLEAAAERAGVNPPTITAEAKQVLTSHAWPGNVRELRNVIERAVVVAEAGHIDARHLMLEAPDVQSSTRATLPKELEAIEKERIVSVLASVDGNQTKAAALLGISRRALINRIEAYGLPRPRKG
jgi:transcriptional regulator with AAA-type ATPase domain